MNRIKEVDVAKGLGILSVILGHLITEGTFHDFIYSFHMPLFFFLSGCVFIESNFRTYLKKKAKGIFIPYLVYGCILLANDFIQVVIGDISIETYKNYLFRFFVFGRKYALWFLPCLFCVSILYWVINKIKKPILKWLTVIAIYLLAMAYYRLGGKKLPWSFDTACVALLYYSLGHGLNTFISKEYNKYKVFLVGLFMFIFCYIANIFSIKNSNHFFDMNSNYYGVFPISFVASVCGIVMIVCISKLLTDNKVLGYLGKYSMIYFALHYLMIQFLSRLFSRYLRSLGNKTTGVWVYYLLVLVIVILVITIINELVIKIKKGACCVRKSKSKK